MTSKQQKEKGYALPSVIDPDRKCVTLFIPNEREHRAAFWGQIKGLAAWYNWKRDEDKTARLVANVWKEVIENAYESFMNDECGEGTVIFPTPEYLEDETGVYLRWRYPDDSVTAYSPNLRGDDGADGVTPIPIWSGYSLGWDLDSDNETDTVPVNLRGATGAAGSDAECDDCAGQEYQAIITNIGCYTRAATTIWNRFKQQMETVATQTETFASFRRDALIKFNRFDEYEIVYDGNPFYEWDMLWRDDSVIFDPAMDSLTAIVLDPDTNPVGHLRCYQTFIAHLTKLAMGQTIPINDVWNDTGQWVEDREDITDIDTDQAGFVYGVWCWELLAHAWAVSDIVDEMRYLANQMERSETNICQYDQADFDEWIGDPTPEFDWCYQVFFNNPSGVYSLEIYPTGQPRGFQEATYIRTTLETYGNESYRNLDVRVYFPATANVKKIVVDHDTTASTFDNVSGGGSNVRNGTTALNSYNKAALPDPYLWEGDITVTSYIGIKIATGSERQAVGNAGGESFLYSVTFWGSGSNPFGTDNC